MKNLIKKATGGGDMTLPQDVVGGLLAGIADSRSSTIIAGGGKPLLRLLKSGTWVYGQNDDPVQEGSEWAINPLSIQHGWNCWSDNPGNTKNELLGETMAPVTAKMPAKPEKHSSGVEWKGQRQFELMCLNGDDEGLEVLYKTGSVGGMRAVDNFLAGLTKQLNANPGFPVAIVQLEVADYDHPKYGQIFNPIFEIVDWASMNGDRLNGDDENPLPDPAPAPAPKAPAAAVRASAAPRRQRPTERA